SGRCGGYRAGRAQLRGGLTEVGLTGADLRDEERGRIFPVAPDYGPAYRQHANDLLALLSLEAATSDQDIFLEVVSRPCARGARTVSIETRSVYDLGQIGAAAVDVPEADRRG